MISAYVGLPRNGKSYGVVANVILPALKRGRRVVTNIPLYEDRIRETITTGEIVEFPIDRVAQDPALIEEYAVAGCVLVLDELWRLWPAGLKANRVPEQFKSLLAEHGHRVDVDGNAMQIVFVTQDLAQIAAFARQLVEVTFFHTKLSHLGTDRQCRVDVLHGGVTGAVPPANNRLRSVHVRFEPKVWNLYKSHTMSESETDGADESSMDRRANVWRRWQIWAGAAGVVLAVVWGTTSLGGLATKYGVNESSEARSLDAVSSSELRSYSAPVAQRPATPTSGSLTMRRSTPPYRVIGTVRNELYPERSVAMITDGQYTTIIPLSECRPVGPVDYTCRYMNVEVGVLGVL
ncbi:MAG: zonular occludens toxin domain-containing protein [Pseudomonadota bacterium]